MIPNEQIDTERETPPPQPSEWHVWASIVSLIWYRRKTTLQIVAFGILISTIVAFVIPKQYESTVQLMPPENQSISTMGMLAGMAGAQLSGVASDLLGVKSSGALFVGILDSRSVQDNIINRFDLRKEYNYKRYVDTRKKLKKRTQVSEDKKTGIISLTVTDNDPRRARDIAEAYVEELNKVVTLQSTSSARREREFLERRIAEVQQDLQNASVALSQFSSKNGTIDIQSQGRAMLEAAATLQGQLIAARSELMALEQVYNADNVRVRSARARVDELSMELKKLGGSSSEPQDTANSSSDLIYPSLRKLPLLGVKYADLYRKMRVEETVFEILTRQVELAKVQEAKEIPVIKILDSPDIAEKKSFPSRALIIVLGSLFSVALAVFWILGKQYWATTDDRTPWKSFVITVLRLPNSNESIRWRVGM